MSTPVPSPGNRNDSLRASDRDRDEVTGRLGQALALGYLTAEEFEQRSTAALAARTRAELTILESDLPRDRLRAADPARTERGRRSRRQLAHVGGYATSVVIMLVIWVATAIAYGPYYFWPIWPILGGVVCAFGHMRELPIAFASVGKRRPGSVWTTK